MAHMKPHKERPTHRFVCDRCGLTAGEHRHEDEALQQARAVATMQGWVWRHPGWVLYCPRCK